MQVWLGLGSNQQNPAARLCEALDHLDRVDGIRVTGTSSFYWTSPWGDEEQDDFVNAVASIESGLDPLALLAEIRVIETRMGRKRSIRRWGPRVIDIDLLLYGDLTCSLDDLEIPHPRMHERAFVLVPLAELDASLEIPGHGRVGDLLREIDCRGIRQWGGADTAGSEDD